MLIKVQLVVSVDAEDLVAEVGAKRAKRLIQRAIKEDALEDIEDILSQVSEVDLKGSLVPIAVRDITVDGADDDSTDEEDDADDCDDEEEEDDEEDEEEDYMMRR